VTASRLEAYELRRYTLHPHVREDFVRLFDAELLESQDATGMRVLGQFRDLDRPDLFVWMRGFRSMSDRHRALTAFYGGPAWRAHRAAANAMMVDSDDVLLLAPVSPGPGLGEQIGPRPAAGADTDTGVVVVDVWPVRPGHAADLLGRYESTIGPLRDRAGGRGLPPLQTLDAVNTFPGLPVREGEYVAVAIARFDDQATADRLLADSAYDAAATELGARTTGPVQRLRLAPTARSALR
jgi:NIPSNAP